MVRRRVRRALYAAGVLAAALAVIGPQISAAQSGDATTYRIYMKPAGHGGSDANDGGSPDHAVASLARVQELLKTDNPETNVQVRVAPGTYVAPPLSWDHYVPGHHITFLPTWYADGAGSGERPVFRNKQSADGTYPRGAWFTARLGGALIGGGDSNLHFDYLQIEDYTDGVSIMGLEYGHDTDGGDPAYFVKKTDGLNRNSMYGMLFTDIGDRWTRRPADLGYGAVVLTNSSHNTIANSHFWHVQNTGDNAPAIHGVYVTHFSSYNTITRSTFKYVTGAPAKVRDRSSYNTFNDSTFTRAGDGEYYRDDVCDPACGSQFDARALECSGHHNLFVDNTLVSGYDGKQNPRVWLMYPWKPTSGEALRYAGDPARCSLPSGEVRLHTWGNVRE